MESLATSLAALFIALLTWHVGEPGDMRVHAAIASAAIAVTSPLLWFYGGVAEIYPSELLVTLLVAYCAIRSLGGEPRWMFLCAAAVGCALVFKVTSALLMLPLAAFAWSRMPAGVRTRTAIAFAAVAVGTAAVFLVAQPNLASVVWNHFVASTSGSRVVGGRTNDLLETLNHNARDVLTGSASALGVLNVAALLAWGLVDRRLPAGLPRTAALLWIAPWLLVFVLLHIGKPGYVLPLLAPAAIVLGTFFARRGRAVGTALIVLQAVVNAGQFAIVSPASKDTLGGSKRYRDKTIVQRLASDLQPLTFSTAFTIRQSDRRVTEFVRLVDEVCPSRDPIVIVDEEPVDWRRVMWYFPDATAARVSGERIDAIGRHSTFSWLPAEGVSLTTRCPIIWVALPETANPLLRPADGTRVGSGWLTPPGTIRIAPEGVRLSAWPSPRSSPGADERSTLQIAARGWR